MPEDKLLKTHEELLDVDEIDAVHVCTPSPTHYQICKEALLAGKDVLLEKPMTLDFCQALKLRNLAKRKGLGLHVGFIFRFNNALKKIRELIADDYFGDLYYIDMKWTTLLLPTPQRDIIFDLGAHPVDIANFLLDMWPNRVVCKARAYTRETLHETAYAIMEFDNNVIGAIELSWLKPGKERTLTVIGSKLCAKIDCLDQSITVFENHDKNGFQIDVEKNNTIRSEIEHFVSHSYENGNSINSGDVGPMNVLVLEYLRHSLIDGNTVNINIHNLNRSIFEEKTLENY
jgi:UDP-2-acetamido-3-amino-2,3-dideoxy-glucuronate N-acetyltransferase